MTKTSKLKAKHGLVLASMTVPMWYTKCTLTLFLEQHNLWWSAYGTAYHCYSPNIAIAGLSVNVF